MNTHDDTFCRVQRFQFYQDTPGQAVLKIVPAEGFDDSDIERIHRNLNRKFVGQMDFRISLIEIADITRSGKAIYVDQRIPRPHDYSSRFDLGTTSSQAETQICKD